MGKIIGKLIVIGLIFLVSAALIGCSGEPLVKKPVPLDSRLLSSVAPPLEYRINMGDRLDVKFFYNPDLNESLLVRTDGRVSMQLVGEMNVLGMTPSQLSAALKETYAKVLKQPEVAVIVRESGGKKIFVDGEVFQPGMHDLVGGETLRHGIAKAGGVRDTARMNEIILIRQPPGKEIVITTINLELINNGEDFKQDIILQPFDIVYVPRSPIANADVWVRQYIRELLPFPFSPGLLMN
jgi:protein involved in polysaccharide export with SLBB domain